MESGVQDRYKRVQEQFDDRDKNEASKSGIGGCRLKGRDAFLLSRAQGKYIYSKGTKPTRKLKGMLKR